MTQKIVLNALKILLISSLMSCDVAIWAIDHNKGELVSSDEKDKKVSCYSDVAKNYACVTLEDLERLKRKCSI